MKRKQKPREQPTQHHDLPHWNQLLRDFQNRQQTAQKNHDNRTQDNNGDVEI